MSNIDKDTKFNFDFKINYDSNNKNLPNKFERDIENLDELYNLLTEENIIFIINSELGFEIETIEEVDSEDWDMYDYIAFIMGMEKCFNVGIDDNLANKFDINVVLDIIKRDNKLKNLGI